MTQRRTVNWIEWAKIVIWGKQRGQNYLLINLNSSDPFSFLTTKPN